MITALRLKLTALLMLGPLVLLLALMFGLWTWSGHNTSLSTTLTQLARLLPADQTLETRDVSGSVRAGGSIGWLRWQQGALSIEARDVQLDWSLETLLQQELRLSKLRIGQLRIEDNRPPTPDAPATPPIDLSLPVKVDAAISIDRLEWAGATTQVFDKLAFNYFYDSYIHYIDKGYISISSGTYEFSGSLQALAPMAIQLQAKGVVQAQVPNSQQHLRVNAQAQLTGSLAGPQARLALQAALTPELPASATATAGRKAAMQASLSAELAPWQVQKIVRAQGQWQALDLAALWPQAPQTLLGGNATVSPTGQGWQAHVELSNRLSGPWNLQRLPVQTLTTDLGFANGQWALQALQAAGAGGQIQASGQLNSGLWQGQAKLAGIHPADLDSRLAGPPMNGTINARQTALGLGFDASLQTNTNQQASPAPTQGSNTLQPLRLQSLSARGVWAAPLLTLQSFRLDAKDAQAQGQIAFNTLSLATQGQLALTLPGLQTTLNGHIASTGGQGGLAIHVSDAALATRWLAGWPVVATALHGASVRGVADLKAQWAGGWQNEARALRIEASLRAPRLDWVRSTATPVEIQPDWRVRDMQADLSGTPGALRLSTQGLAEAGAQRLDWQAQAMGERVKEGSWQASIHQFRLALQDGTQSAPWSLRWGAESTTGATAAKPVTLAWQQTNIQNTLVWSAGTAKLQGPAAGSASISWQPGQWSQQSAMGTTRWQTQGRISSLPLAWVDAVSGKTIAELGISSDMTFSGDWDAAQTDTLRLRATLERSAGDIRLHADDLRQRALPAGMQEAWMQINLNGNQLSSSLRWDSELAGKALMAFSTQLQLKANGWAWAIDAPLGGSLQMKLPPMAAWSVLAPPGWRLRGTLDANISLTGTLALPQWSGDLRARNLAVRSLVDGIDFSQGSLNAHLHGQQLDIENFTLQGAGGTSGAGGQLAMTGSVFWLPGNTTNKPVSRLSMALEAQAKALRLSSRPNRRVVVSGKLAAQLNDARLSLRGALAADQALITLPDDTSPELGEDVVVRRPAAPATAPLKADTQRPTSDRSTSSPVGQVIPDVQIDLDLGPDFQLRGRGLETRLAGKLTLVALGPATPSLSGTVRTVRGTYLAYGQRLEIEQGVLRFTGPLDNPALAILAIRSKLTQRVGVQISGTALSPMVRLYADPDLPDAEKLAWLVLGRSGSGGGAETALMQQAALALLGGNGKNLSASLTQALGIDELSFRGNTSAGDNTASGASVTLGKRLSSDFYLAYESSLNGAMGVFYIFYDLSRRLTLRAQAGEQSAIDLVFTLRYD